MVAAAGTSDRPVAAEATAVATAVGLDTTAVHDVGVAGLERVLQVRGLLRSADAVIVVAGMEGALASVVGGLVAAPVVAVPVSTGYGASLDGVTALLAMHASCAMRRDRGQHRLRVLGSHGGPPHRPVPRHSGTRRRQVICWINPFTGLAGDMLLGALIDAGAPLDRIRSAVSATGLTGWDLTAERVTDHGLAATRVRVEVTDPCTERRAAEVIEMASRAAPRPVATLAVAALTAIAEVEGRLHDADPATVHLHELGGHDTLVDIVGSAAALHAFGVTDVISSPLPLGRGEVNSAHGVLPCPAPTTLALLTGAAVRGCGLPGETVTPTGAAILRAVRARYGPPPP